MEIAEAIARVDRLQLPTVFDIEADGRLLAVEHPRIHREAHVRGRLAKIGLQHRQPAMRLARRTTQRKKDLVLAGLGAADGERIAFERQRPAGPLLRLRQPRWGNRQENETKEGQPGANEAHSPCIDANFGSSVELELDIRQVVERLLQRHCPGIADLAELLVIAFDAQHFRLELVHRQHAEIQRHADRQVRP